MKKTPFVIAIPVYDGVNLMDIAAPREVFHWAREDASVQKTTAVSVLFVADAETVVTLNGVRFTPDCGFDDPRVADPALLWVPGGSPGALRAQLNAPGSAFFQFIRRVGATASYVCSVCEGAVLLASTGLLDGYQATTHWAFYPCMAAYPEVTMVGPMVQGDAFLYPRYVHDRNRVTGGGITSGLDEALFLTKLVFGLEVAESVAQTTQYAPDPPITARFGPSGACPIPTASAPHPETATSYLPR